ncbi:hypothetical protein Tco_0288080, partial [Tanacetum coccineum]
KDKKDKKKQKQSKTNKKWKRQDKSEVGKPNLKAENLKAGSVGYKK